MTAALPEHHIIFDRNLKDDGTLDDISLMCVCGNWIVRIPRGTLAGDMGAMMLSAPEPCRSARVNWSGLA